MEAEAPAAINHAHSASIPPQRKSLAFRSHPPPGKFRVFFAKLYLSLADPAIRILGCPVLGLVPRKVMKSCLLASETPTSLRVRSCSSLNWGSEFLVNDGVDILPGVVLSSSCFHTTCSLYSARDSAHKASFPSTIVFFGSWSRLTVGSYEFVFVC